MYHIALRENHRKCIECIDNYPEFSNYKSLENDIFRYENSNLQYNSIAVAHVNKMNKMMMNMKTKTKKKLTN